MKRKDFIKKTLMGAVAVTAGTKMADAQKSINPAEQVGFEHIPKTGGKTMKTLIHRSETRGHANHGWLDSHHTFSFANYYDPNRVHFGALRVLNDDIVAGGMGFGTHPHSDMEIISIPLEGDLEHKDSMGNTMVIKQGDVQIMSAGSGVKHSEYNKNKDKEVNFLQIWVFPKEKGVKPNYEQITFNTEDRINQWQQIVSPTANDGAVTIGQDAWFYLSKIEAGKSLSYEVKKNGNGVYAFLIDGKATVAGEPLNKRDGAGIWDTGSFEVQADADTEILLMEVPMQV
jgi:redox-sensitive bicupin YhaK (pirin superfamily)